MTQREIIAELNRHYSRLDDLQNFINTDDLNKCSPFVMLSLRGILKSFAIEGEENFYDAAEKKLQNEQQKILLDLKNDLLDLHKAEIKKLLKKIEVGDYD